MQASDPDDTHLVFAVRLLGAESLSLLRVDNDALKTASVYLNAPLNAVVRHRLLTYLR